jgi:hypothetical protein
VKKIGWEDNREIRRKVVVAALSAWLSNTDMCNM